MPQLDTSTFASQIFWILIGFLLVYLFVSKFTSRIELILQRRNTHVDSMLTAAYQLENKAALMEKAVVIAMEDAQVDSAAAEAESLAVFREQNLKEKSSLYSLFSKKSKRESDALKKSAQEVYANVENQMDELANLVIDVLNSGHQAS